MIIGKQRLIVSVPPSVGYWIGLLISKLVGDVVITREEIDGLMARSLHTEQPPAGTTKLTDWGAEHTATLGTRYAGELARRRNWQEAYDSL